MEERPLSVIVVMGVSGSGKSTLGGLLAKQLGCPFLEGDDFHSAASVEKMRAGHPLNDADRWPWLARLAAAASDAAKRDGGAVVACSALKRIYRERLINWSGLPMRFVLLEASPAVLTQRLTERPHHYMPTSLLSSQLAALERPGADELAITLESTRAPHELSAEALAWVNTAWMVTAR